MFQVKVRVKSQIYIFNKKIIIFEIKQNTEVENNSGQKAQTIKKGQMLFAVRQTFLRLTFVRWDSGQQIAQCIVRGNAQRMIAR